MSEVVKASRITLDPQKKLRTMQMFRVLVKSLSLTGWLFSNTNDLRSSRTRRLCVSSGQLEEFTDINSFLRSKPRPTIRDEQQAKSSKNRQMEACFQKQHNSVSLTLYLNSKPTEEGWPYGNSVKACFQTEWPEGRLHKWAPAHSLAAQIY